MGIRCGARVTLVWLAAAVTGAGCPNNDSTMDSAISVDRSAVDAPLVDARSISDRPALDRAEDLRFDAEGAPCGAIPRQGCCEGRLLWFCNNFKKLQVRNCARSDGGATSCGWDHGWKRYDCLPSGGADPSGRMPRSCRPRDLGPRDLRPDRRWIDAGDLGPPDLRPHDLPLPLACGSISYVGCCENAKLKYCSGGGLQVLDCTNAALGGPKCGWSVASAGYDCGTAGKADPAGKHPKTCPQPSDAAAP